MIVTIVHLEVNPAYIDQFIRASTENHLESVKEPGNLRFDLLRNNEDPNRFVLYEAYQNATAAAAHKETAHYLKWREKVAP
jgi:(4S)-4-hydroxy-5-phosphonooxypentane-2,3-dione isomerase